MEKFKLNYESRKKLREDVSQEIKSKFEQKRIRQDAKIKLDKDVLETILFEEVLINPSLGIVVKLPVCSGLFLRGVDLSEVSFEDVSWGLLGKYGNDYFGILHTLLLAPGADKKAGERIEKLRESFGDYLVNFSNTNATIDLSKSFEAKYGACVNISSCVLSSVNIITNNFDHINRLNIFNSFVEMPIPSSIELTAYDSNLDDIDLSGRTIDGYDYLYGSPAALAHCSLQNTHISIKLVPGKFNMLGAESYDFMVNVPPLLQIWDVFSDKEKTQKTTESDQANEKKKIRTALRNVVYWKWEGCYLNGKLNISIPEKKEKRDIMKAEYEKEAQAYTKGILCSIKEQTKRKKGR